MVIEDVSDPLLPTPAAIIDLPTQIRQVSFDAPYMAVATLW